MRRAVSARAAEPLDHLASQRTPPSLLTWNVSPSWCANEEAITKITRNFVERGAYAH